MINNKKGNNKYTCSEFDSFRYVIHAVVYNKKVNIPIEMRKKKMNHLIAQACYLALKLNEKEDILITQVSVLGLHEDEETVCFSVNNIKCMISCFQALFSLFGVGKTESKEFKEIVKNTLNQLGDDVDPDQLELKTIE